jgi:hypothetical protein
MKCRKTICLFYDKDMTDNCAKGEPPDIKHCNFRTKGIKYSKVELREAVRRYRTALNHIADYKGDDPYVMQLTAAIALGR